MVSLKAKSPSRAHVVSLTSLLSLGVNWRLLPVEASEPDENPFLEVWFEAKNNFYKESKTKHLEFLM